MRWREIKKGNTAAPDSDDTPAVSYAGFIVRTKALITDLFMIYAPILYIITYVVMGGKDDFQSSQLAPLVGVTLYALIYAVLLARSGQTPGKKAYDIKVVDAKTFETVSFFRAFLRFAAFLFSAMTLLGIFILFYRNDKRTLHDLLSGTAVVYTEIGNRESETGHAK